MTRYDLLLIGALDDGPQIGYRRFMVATLKPGIYVDEVILTAATGDGLDIPRDEDPDPDWMTWHVVFFPGESSSSYGGYARNASEYCDWLQECIGTIPLGSRVERTR